MARMQSATRITNKRKWPASSIEDALRLLAQMEERSQRVFSSPTDFGSFLDLVTRLHHYDAYNLLLIWQRVPNASLLAGYKTWARQTSGKEWVLNEESRGKKYLSLIAPFTDGENKCLTWHDLHVYDVSQTTLELSPPSFDPAYIHDKEHSYFLLDSLKEVLSNKFDRSVFIEHPSQRLIELELPGEISERSVTAREDMSEKEILAWLTDALCQLAIAEVDFPPKVKRLLKNSILYCLLNIWGLSEMARKPNSSLQLKELDQGHLSFLRCLRDTVRELNNLIASCYLRLRQDSKDPEDLELEDIMDEDK